MKFSINIFLVFSLLFVFSCKKSAPKVTEAVENFDDKELLEAPDWSKNANIYEVNLRQYSEEGTFNAFARHLPRLDSMGVDILWLMPIFPISEVNRKATQTTLIEEIEDPEERKKYLGSYYSVKDFKAVNPDLGTIEEFKQLVEQIHNLDMKVILDWVPNHTGWDHDWIKSHPDYYVRVEKGNTPWNPEWMEAHPEFYKMIMDLEMTYPIDPNETDWWDTADLNYDNPELRAAMTDAMSFWVTEFDVDGFRCDVAGQVPNDFWADNNETLFSKKHLFMLAEVDIPSVHNAGFHMTYGWGFHHRLNQIAQGEIALEEFESFLQEDTAKYGPKAYRMNFITNHDENSWNGTVEERMGDAADAMAVIAFTLDGMPLIYSGQEAGLNKRLKFFEKDEISWENLEKAAFYTTLLKLKHDNKALWNGIHGGKFRRIKTDNDKHILCYSRAKEGAELVVAVNASANNQSFKTSENLSSNDFLDVFSGETVNPGSWTTTAVELEPWAYKVLSYNP